MNDPLDQPEPEGGYDLFYPFVACQSQGGPYEDESFVAGVQLGRIDQAMATAARAGLGVDRLRVPFAVRTELVKQIELAAMAYGFQHIEVTGVEETEDHAAMPEWSFVTIGSPA